MQHICVLEGRNQDLFESILSSALELRLDQVTLHEWHRYSKESEGLPSYTNLLDFIDIPACDVDDDTEQERKCPVGTANKEDWLRVSYVMNVSSDTRVTAWCANRSNIICCHAVFLDFSP